MPRYKCPGIGDSEKDEELRVEPATRSKDPDEPHGCAPLKPVFVNDAISDLVSEVVHVPLRDLISGVYRQSLTGMNSLVV